MPQVDEATLIDHPDARILVDTGMTELGLAVAASILASIHWCKQDFDLAGIVIVVRRTFTPTIAAATISSPASRIIVQRREARRRPQQRGRIPDSRVG